MSVVEKHLDVWKASHSVFKGTSTSRDSYAGAPYERPPLTQRHHSEFDLTNGGKTFYGETTSSQTYRGHPSDGHTDIQISKGLFNIGEGKQFYGQTTSTMAFQSPPRIEVQSHNTQAPRILPKTKFYGTTTSSETYVKFSAERQQPFKPTPSQGFTLGDFDGTTTARDSYTSQQTTRPHIVTREEMEPHNQFQGDRKFHGDSESRSAYVEHRNISVNDITKPSNRSLEGVLQGSGKMYFLGSTTNMEAYQQWPLEHRVHCAKPEYSPNTIAFSGTTESKQQYQSYPVNPPQSCKPPLGSFPMEVGSFQPHSSTSRETFKGWQLPKQRLAVGMELSGDRVHVMIHKNRLLPTNHEQIFTTVANNQDTVEIVVLQGDSQRASNNKILASFELVGIPKAKAGAPKIAVNFIVNDQGVLHVEAKDCVTGYAHTIAVPRTF